MLSVLLKLELTVRGVPESGQIHCPFPRGPVPILELAQEDFSGMLRRRVDGAAGGPSKHVNINAGTALLPVEPNAQDSAQLWHPMVPPFPRGTSYCDPFLTTETK